VTVPEWKPLLDLHPCDLQASMLKKCTPANVDADAFYAHERRKHVRAVYYAMITEFDAMVGEYVSTVEAAGATDNTIFIVTSDHGDMNMEHQQFYKMVQYDASCRVPLIISSPWTTQSFVTSPTHAIDLFPTIAEMAGMTRKEMPAVIDGQSLVPFLHGNKSAGLGHTSIAVSQFHGCNIAMSWYLAMDGRYKYVVFGTGKEVPPQLFDLKNDVGEQVNLAATMPDIVKQLDAKLRAVVDYEAVSTDVADYNQLSFKAWMGRTPDWKQAMVDLRWKTPFTVNQNASIAAIENWLAAPPKVEACRDTLIWNHDEL